MIDLLIQIDQLLSSSDFIYSSFLSRLFSFPIFYFSIVLSGGGELA